MLQLQFLSSPPVSAQTSKFNTISNPKLFPSFSSLKSLQNYAFKFNTLSLTSKPSKFSLKCGQSEYFDQKQRFNNSSSTSPPPSSGSPPRYYVGHSIYKGKAALTVEPKAPEFVPLDSGAFKISREGFVLLQFAPAAGVRQYDWGRKQVFSLSVTEIGTLISLGTKESCEFFHDPFKGKSDEGKVRKVLKVEPLPDGSGHFFNLGVQNKLVNMDESIYIPITLAEFTVLKSAFSFILPYLLGWHAFANSTKPDEASRVNNANPRYGGDYEWSR
ncbi:Single-stranded DNA-binding protein WHY1 [Hibiscus syriacus]|uniref:Single-stranded DNA-binding protein WHY1 n=1 Tax=Hibiscus syriacus TaxID=106335 RepID=A0A6A2WS39_HIBSY|nr:single-stranded DNA-binding protein WHY1, chloroplastic-like isoform X2 [Hibiscus syriacus]KAE8663221.1 Single-stranded DNA-binding protein WHY1 [Hibiscus syriacus]